MKGLLELCSCPRVDGEALTRPLCAIVNFIEGNHDVAFVAQPPGLYCKAAMNFGGSMLCNCTHRLRLYRTHGI